MDLVHSGGLFSVTQPTLVPTCVCLCVCVCVCMSTSVPASARVFVYVCVLVSLCMRVSVCVDDTHICIYVYIHINLYEYVCIRRNAVVDVECGNGVRDCRCDWHCGYRWRLAGFVCVGSGWD